MKNTSFRVLSDQEKRARLLGVIANKTGGQLSKAELEEIVNNIDISNQYSISILHDAKEFGEKLRLEDSGWENGDNYNVVEETGQLLLGSNLEFGEKGSLETYYNGNLSREYDNSSDADFDTMSKYAVSIQHVSKSCSVYGYNETMRFNETNSLVIYIPDAQQPFKIAPKIQYILDNFEIK